MEKDDVLLNISIDSTAENIWKVLTDEQAFNECFENIKKHSVLFLHYISSTFNTFLCFFFFLIT